LARVNFKLPVIVKDVKVEGKTNYYLKPLFIPFPIAIHPRFSQAVSQLRQEIKIFFRGFKIDRNQADRLTWFLFSPEFNYQQIFLEFKLGREWVKGNFSVVDFEFSGHTFVYFPMIRHYMFIAKPDQKGNINIKEQAKKAIKKQLQVNKTMQGADFKPGEYYSEKKEFITHIKMNLNVEQGSFKYEQQETGDFFAALNEEDKFEGSLEVEKVGFDYNSLFPDQINRAWEREAEVNRLSELLYSKNNVPVAIIGPEGVGKHSILQESIFQYLSEPKPSAERKQNIWHLNPNRIIAGMSIIGHWQKRLEAIIDFIRHPEGEGKAPDKLLFDNSIALLTVGKSAQNNLAFSDILKPYLEKRTLQVILIATLEEWKIIQEKNRSFAGLFQVLRLQAPDTETSIKILLKKRKQLELDHYLSITINAISQLLDLHRNFLSNKALPGSIIDILDQLATKFKFGTIDAPEIREAFRNVSGLDRQLIEKDHVYQKDEIRTALRMRLIGQDQAVEALADAIHLTKAKLTDSSKPQSSFLFIGPTGVGKTEAAKAICQYLMSDERKLMRFDMNEFIDGDAAQRLTGTSARPEGLLTGKLRYNPFGILLFDEIEKAHPEVHDLLLQILDDGRLTDGAGRTVDFCNTIIIMTSNIGAADISRTVGFGNTTQDIQAIYIKAVENFFRPELINRIDKIVIFDTLKPEHITRIAQLQIKELLKRDGFVQRTTILNISNEALEWVSKRGYDPKMGGRALKRQIENDLTKLSADHLVSATDNTPIIFHVLLKNGRLEPQIEKLEFCPAIPESWLPKMPDYTQNSRSFYRKLQSDVQKIERTISRIKLEETLEEDGFGMDYATRNWQFYHFKERMATLVENINNVLLSQSGKFQPHGKTTSLRIRLTGLEPIQNWSGNNKESFIQEKSLEEISRHLNQLTPLFDSISSDFIGHYIDAALTRVQSSYFIHQKIDYITLSFESSIKGRGGNEIDFLIDHYLNLFEILDIQYELDKKQKTVSAEGYGLAHLFKGENGLQLFYSLHLPPLPIRIKIKDESGVNLNESKIIRLFYNGQTMLDLRTGFLNVANMTPEEFKFIWFAGVL
jgi:ATP-dependent Clp protease ATP-binding subunit ClpC